MTKGDIVELVIPRKSNSGEKKRIQYRQQYVCKLLLNAKPLVPFWFGREMRIRVSSPLPSFHPSCCPLSTYEKILIPVWRSQPHTGNLKSAEVLC